MAGHGGVPASGVSAVSLNVTSTESTEPGFVTVYPCGVRPPTSSLNHLSGITTPNSVIAPLSAAGSVCLYTQQATHLVVDLNGWFAASSGFHALTPDRISDSRLRPVPPCKAASVQVADRIGDHPGIDASGISIGYNCASWSVAVSTAQPIDLASLDLAIVALDTNMNPFDGCDGGDHLLAFGPAATSGIVWTRFVTPTCDSASWTGGQARVSTSSLSAAAISPADLGSPTTLRAFAIVWTNGIDAGDLVPDWDFAAQDGTTNRVQPGEVVRIPVLGVAGVPASGVEAVSVNVTVTEPANASYATAYPCNSTPSTSTLNYLARQTIANAAIVPVDASGSICLISPVASEHLVVDLNGWFGSPPG